VGDRLMGYVLIGNSSWFAGALTAPFITINSLPTGTANVAYSANLTATGLTPITWSVTAGNSTLTSANLTLTSGGLLSGTANAAVSGNVTFLATNSIGNANTTLTLTVSASGSVPTLTSLSSYGNIVGTTDFTLTATGTFQSGDQIELWNTLLTTTYVNSTTLTATVTTAKMASRNFGCVRIARGTERSYPLPFEAYDTATYPSNYVTNASSIISLTYGTAPAKGEVRTLTTTGNQIVRQTAIADSNGGGGLYTTTNFTNTYATFSSQNCNGTYFIADTELSYASDLYRKSDQVNLGAIRRGVGSGVNDLLGEVHELRWDTLGDRPNVVYYVKGMALYERNIVSGSAEVLIKDFTSDFPSVAAGSYIQCDVEGIPSIDCRYWAFMLRHPYVDAFTFQGIYCFIWYDKLKNTFTTADNTVFGVTKRFNSGATFYRPNMCSMSLRGDRFITHYGRVYPSGDTGRESEFGTATDQPRAWSTSFTNPKIISIDETHGSQAFDSSMNQTWVSQCNAGYDSVEWADISIGGTYRQAGATLASQNLYTSPTAGTGRTQLINQATDGYGGYHVSTCMSGVRRGFVSISGYNSESPATIGAQQFRIYRLSDARVWRVGHKPGTYPAGDSYRNEAQVAVSHDFTELMCGGNWNDLFTPSGHREYFITYLPRDWHTNAIWS
jgi:predicted heme/steroid binding protein